MVTPGLERAASTGRWVVGLLLLVGALGGLFGCRDTTAPAFRSAVSLNGVWAFYPGGGSERYDIRVPSFWDAPQDYGYPSDWLHLRHGVYRRRFTVPADFADRRLFLRIGRLSVIGQVFVNGHRIGGETTRGYLMMQLPYTLEITDLVHRDRPNDLEIRVWGGQSIVHGRDQLDPTEVDFPADAFEDGKLLFPYCVDHYDGRRGIDGDVTLLARPRVYVSDVQVIPDLKQNTTQSDDEINLHVTVSNGEATPVQVDIRSRASANGAAPGKVFARRTLTITPGGTATASWSGVSWVDAAYWWPDTPNLYDLSTELLRDGRLLDREETRFGFRQFYVVGNHLELNGLKLHLRGDAYEFSWHEGYRHGPSTAPVISTKELVPEMQRRLLEEYRALNMNVLRPHKASGIDELYDLCDETGMLVMDEAPFWQVFQRTDSRARPYYMEWVRRWVTERKNHPSIIMWIVGNECWGSEIPEFNAQAASEVDPSRPIFHEGVRPGDFQGDLESLHYTGGYPMQVFNTTDLYDVYSVNPTKPRGEGEALFADGWPLKDAAGNLSGKRSARGEWDNPDLISQAEWVRGVARLIRGMRFAELPDSRLYADWWYCFEPIEETLHPDWPDLAAPGIKPTVLHRPIVNVFDPSYPEVRHADGYDYWRNSYAPVAVFDLEHDRTSVIGRDPQIFQPGDRLKRRIVVYNDTLHGGTRIRVGWTLASADPLRAPGEVLGQGRLDLDVGCGERQEAALDLQIPSDSTGGRWLTLELTAAQGERTVFSETNRLGALIQAPAPHLTASPSRFDLGVITPERAEQLRKIRLVNTGGGRSLHWRVEGSHEFLLLRPREGNLRGEQEVHFRIDTAGLETGRSYRQHLRFVPNQGPPAEVEIAFSVE